MTEKRFTYEYDEYSGNLFDNKMNTFYHIEDSDENIEILCDRLNWLVEENKQLEKDNLDLSEELGYYKTKCASLETGLFQADRENGRLKSICQDHRDHATDFKADCVRLEKENEKLKQQISYYEKKEVEWLRDNTVWEQMPSNKRTVTKTKFER